MTLKTVLIATVWFGAIVFAGSAAAEDATDYSALSNEQLIQLRSEVRNMSTDERARFRTEMQSRAQTMTPEQRTEAGIGPRNTDGNGQGQQTQKRDGTGNQDRATDRKRDGTGNQDRANDRRRDGRRYGDGQGTHPRQGGGRGN
ncbi:MAG: hypothetical protein AB7V26_04705 [Lysobacterales bacterium]